MAEFNLSLYDDEFFAWHLKYAREYSIKTMDWFLDRYNIKSVLDVGCGIGSYLEAAHNKGLLDLCGIEISESARKYTPQQIQKFIIYCDATDPIKITPGFDCVLSFETAEHIEPSGTDQFIDNLVNLTSWVLLFTAAPPGQDGCGHINCQPKEYWMHLIGKRMTYDEGMTNEVSHAWRSLGAPNYICDNLIIFKR